MSRMQNIRRRSIGGRSMICANCSHEEDTHFFENSGTMFANLSRADKKDYSHGCDIIKCSCHKFVAQPSEIKGCGIEFQRENMSELRACGQEDIYFEDTSYCKLCSYKIDLLKKLRPLVDNYVDMTVHKMEMWQEVCYAVVGVSE